MYRYLLPIRSTAVKTFGRYQSLFKYSYWITARDKWVGPVVSPMNFQVVQQCRNKYKRRIWIGQKIGKLRHNSGDHDSSLVVMGQVSWLAKCSWWAYNTTYLLTSNRQVAQPVTAYIIAPNIPELSINFELWYLPIYWLFDLLCTLCPHRKSFWLPLDTCLFSVRSETAEN